MGSDKTGPFLTRKRKRASLISDGEVRHDKPFGGSLQAGTIKWRKIARLQGQMVALKPGGSLGDVIRRGR